MAETEKFRIWEVTETPADIFRQALLFSYVGCILKKKQETLMDIQIIPAYSQQEEIRCLFQEYTELLAEGDSQFRKYLQIQNYDAEISHPEEKYSMPKGRLYLALADGNVAGCIALRKLNMQQCEMKRLYVRPEFQGHGIGRMLTEQILLDAKQIGYRMVLLDTFPFLQRALTMYRHMGFREIPRYNDSPMDSTIFLALDL